MTDDTAVIRRARLEDVPAMRAMVHDLAAYEKAPELCHLTEEQLRAALFGEHVALYAHVVVTTKEEPRPDEPRGEVDGEVAGMAIWFLNYSTWDGVHGIYLEDLYVRPEHRGSGLGKALLVALSQECVRNGWSRLSWQVLDWNAPAIGFYESIGAKAQDEWTTYRLSGPELAALAEEG
ncbi:MAG: GNAT family N-acetyltransferase [Segniliparus sp.]|uniref:GNAT family N-acetyltransferase n=1 Tax=Segniliparus sp. TaxID=2804064 RepID=UPI003F389072